MENDPFSLLFFKSTDYCKSSYYNVIIYNLMACFKVLHEVFIHHPDLIINDK